jgi:hypothetical protein
MHNLDIAAKRPALSDYVRVAPLLNVVKLDSQFQIDGGGASVMSNGAD